MRRAVMAVWVVCVLCCGGGEVQADPCGMVPPPPPPYLRKTTLIERVGAQKTYVFYKKGIESFVLRPGFRGKVDNFGMLIPFPSPPAIRKVPNEIFSQIAAAIDPPEVVVRVWRRRRWGRRSMMGMAPKSAARRSRPAADRLAVHEVRVLRQEAVGMYQVAVLQAGSPKALARWMKRHGYLYPKGMDKVCYDYIKAGWTFVAVKARVSSKKGIAPRPGMRSVRPSFPKNGFFTGKVQAMGFRFRSRRLVVPMRLSAYNKGRLRNIVYLLTSGPRRIRRIPKEFVMRQISGRQLYRNVTEPLPLRIIGGRASQIRAGRWMQAQRLRNPAPHNGHAKDLFASDLLAARLGKLSLGHERKKKVLLRIGEELNLRGDAMDRLNRQVLQKQMRKTVGRSIRALRSMTMTVVDGDFPRKVIASANLTFARYRMPTKCNSSGFYNARTLRRAKCGMRAVRLSGTRYTKRGPHYKGFGNKGKRRTKKRLLLSGGRYYYRLIRRLSSPKRAEKVVAQLVRAGQRAVPYLLGEAIEGSRWTRRGWSIVALSRIKGGNVNKGLRRISRDGQQHTLVRSWSAAALLMRAQDAKEILALKAPLPALKRPLRLRLMALMRTSKQPGAVLFGVAGHNSTYHSWLRKLLTAQPPAITLPEMIQGKDLPTRRTAASYASLLMRKDAQATIKTLFGLLDFNRKATRVPWAGGALYLPAWPNKTLPRFVGWKWRNRLQRMLNRRQWDLLPDQLDKYAQDLRKARADWRKAVEKKTALNAILQQRSKQLVRTLLAWAIWAKERGQKAELRKIFNNLNNWNLVRLAKIPRFNPQTPLDRRLQAWGEAHGKAELKQLLRDAGVHRMPKYTISYIYKSKARALAKARALRGKYYEGCYADSSRRDLPVYIGGYHTPQTCRSQCRRRGYKYAGLQYGYQCFCGNSYGKYGRLSERHCSYRCRYDRKQFCGGSYRNSVYRVR